MLMEPIAEGVEPEGPVGKAFGMELPPAVAESVESLQKWAACIGPKAECALFSAFFPPIAEIDAKARESGCGAFNPTAVEDVDVARARATLIQLRDAFLMPSIWNPDYVVMFSHVIAALHQILLEAIVTGLETDGVGPETG